jgi:cobalt-zinc-cadmium efflux system outer membrane protein
MRLLAALALVLVPTLANAQAAPLELSTVLTSVERHHPLIAAADRDRDAADGELRAAEGSFDPQWRTRAAGAPVGYYNPLTIDTSLVQPTRLWGTTLFAGWRLGEGLSYTGIPIYDGKIETNTLGEVRAGLSVPLWRNGPIDRARANIQRAELGRTMAALSAQQQRLELGRLAAQRYWEWVAAGRRLAVARELLALATERDAALGERVTRGDLPALERTDNTRAIVQREGAVVAARRSVEQAAIELSLYVRDARGEPRVASLEELPSAVPEPAALDAGCVARDARAATTARPEPRRFEAQRDRERVEREWAENQQRPAIDVMVAASHDLGQGPQSRQGPVLEAGLVLDIPLLNRVATGRTRVAEAGVARAEEQRRLALDRVAADVRDAVSALEAARERVGVARREVAVAREVAELERQRLALGDGTLLVLNLREVAAAEARIREVDALLEWQRAAAAYRFAVGAAPGAGVSCATGAPRQ